MMNVRLNIFVACLSGIAAFLLCTPAHARHVVASNTFDSTLHGWRSNTWSTLDNPLTGGVGDSGWMSTTWTNLTDGAGDPLPNEPDPGADWWSDLYVTEATNLFTGVWLTNMWFEMDFWASNKEPGTVQIQWWAEGSNRVWKNTIWDDVDDTMATQTWTTLKSASLMDYLDWGLPFGRTQADFVDDLASIDWIGIRIWRGDIAGDTYGIDNFNLMIPEPAEIILLLFAGVSSLMALRKKEREGVKRET